MKTHPLFFLSSLLTLILFPLRCDLEDALRRSRQESDHLRKQLAEAHRVAMSQASSSMPPPPPLAPQQASQSSNSASGSVGGTVTSTGVAGTTVPGSQSQANVYKGNTANSFHVSQDQYISGI